MKAETQLSPFIHFFSTSAKLWSNTQSTQLQGKQTDEKMGFLVSYDKKLEKKMIISFTWERMEYK